MKSIFDELTPAGCSMLQYARDMPHFKQSNEEDKFSPSAYLMLQYARDMANFQQSNEEDKSWARKNFVEEIMQLQSKRRRTADLDRQARADIKIANLWQLYKKSFYK